MTLNIDNMCNEDFIDAHDEAEREYEMIIA